MSTAFAFIKTALFQIEDVAMQQQVESYKYALREWDEQQQRHRAAVQHAR